MNDAATFAETRVAEDIARCATELCQAMMRARAAGFALEITLPPEGVRVDVRRIVVAPKFKPVLGVP